ncbi:unnamed protein product [Sphagnum balticum]
MAKIIAVEEIVFRSGVAQAHPGEICLFTICNHSIKRRILAADCLVMLESASALSLCAKRERRLVLAEKRRLEEGEREPKLHWRRPCAAVVQTKTRMETRRVRLATSGVCGLLIGARQNVNVCAKCSLRFHVKCALDL